MEPMAFSADSTSPRHGSGLTPLLFANARNPSFSVPSQKMA